MRSRSLVENLLLHFATNILYLPGMGELMGGFSRRTTHSHQSVQNSPSGSVSERNRNWPRENSPSRAANCPLRAARRDSKTRWISFGLSSAAESASPSRVDISRVESLLRKTPKTPPVPHDIESRKSPKFSLDSVQRPVRRLPSFHHAQPVRNTNSGL